jgi:hypothetical protein
LIPRKKAALPRGPGPSTVLPSSRGPHEEDAMCPALSHRVSARDSCKSDSGPSPNRRTPAQKLS